MCNMVALHCMALNRSWMDTRPIGGDYLLVMLISKFKSNKGQSVYSSLVLISSVEVVLASRCYLDGQTKK